VKRSDITDKAFLDAIRTVHQVRSGGRREWTGASIWDIAAVLGGHPEWCGQPEAADGSVTVPVKVVRAKAAQLVRHGLIDGCANCACRGDFTIRDDPAAPQVRHHSQRPYRGVSNTETRAAPGLQMSPFV
jgi:hypothetical protein